MNVYHAITLYQPWATWIIRGWKTIETRTHSRFSSLEGKYVLIHAGKSTDASAINNPYLTKDQLLQNPDEMVNGYIIGSAHCYQFGILDERFSQRALIDCANTTRYGLFLQDIKKFDNPIPVLGEMGIWYFDMDTKMKVKKQQLEKVDLFTI